MPARQVRAASALLLAVLLCWGATPAFAAKSYRAEHYSVRIEVRADGSVEVTETVRFAFGPDSFTSVRREVPERRTDGITYVGASMDGRAMPRGRAPGEFEVGKRDNGRRRIVFHFAPVTSSVHTFTLTYVAAGVVRQYGDADVLEWNLLPSDHDYSIDRADGEIRVPPSAVRLGTASLGPASGEWQPDGRTLRIWRGPVGPDQAWPVTLRFAPRTVTSVLPGWQRRDLRTRETMPMFLGLAGLILLTGIGGFLLFRLNNRPELLGDPQARAEAPPDRLPVAMAGAVTVNWMGVTWMHALGALLDLARRGVVRIDEARKDGLFKTRTFVIHRTGAAAPPVRHEQALLDLLFVTKSGPRDSVPLSEVTRAVTSSGNWKRFGKAVTEDLRRAGLLDEDRERLRSRVTVLGLVLVAVGMAGLVVSVPLLERVGDAVLSLPAALVAVGITGLGAGATFSTLSDEGRRRALSASAYKRHLEDLSKQSSSSSVAAGVFDRALPYAAAFGLAVGWAKHLEKQGVTAGPAWLGALAHDGAESHSHMAATVAMLSAVSSAGGQAGHGAGGTSGGGSAAGGGSSSAH